MNTPAQPACRIGPDGVAHSLDSPYEQGRYAQCIGDTLVDNPFSREDKLNRRLWEKGFNESRADALRNTQ